MDDWFNKHGNSNRDEEKRGGRIFHDFEYDSTFDSQDGSKGFPAEEKQEAEFDFDSILGASGNGGNLDFEKTESDIKMAGKNKAEFNTAGTDFEDVSSGRNKPGRKKSRGKKIFLSIVSIFLVLVIVLVGYAYKLVGSLSYAPDTRKENAYISSSELASSAAVKNILIMGTDKRESQANFRADTMMLLSIDTEHKMLKLTSFLRDSWTYIPAKDFYAKLNAACSYGGAQMVIDTIEYNYKVDIDNYVMIDFDVFKDIINGIGGITLTITEAEAANITKEGGFKCKSGTRHVKGRTALWYARIRHLDSDFNRTARQRKVIAAVIEQVKSCGIPTLLSVVESVLPKIQTDLNKNELMSLGIKALFSYMNYDLAEQQIPAKGTWWNATVGGQAVLKFNLDENIEILEDFIFNKGPDADEEKTSE